jgi:pimeloyl-ACP methyl ester carboxylesterase
VGTAAASTVVLVHGAWHGAWAWSKVVAGLADAGVPAVAIDLPGHGDSTAPLGDLAGDADHTAREVASVAGPVVLVGHSYGGAVITQAAAAASNVQHLVYLAAFCIDEGESVSGVAAAWPDQASLGAAIRPADGVFTLAPDLAAGTLYGSCDPDDVAAAIAQLGPQPAASLFQPVSAAAWKTITSTYVVCERDQGVPPSLQRHMAQRCTDVLEWDCDHSPFLSEVDATVSLLARLAGAS